MKVFVFAALVAVVAAGGYQQTPVYKQEKPYVSPPALYYPPSNYKDNKPAYQPEYNKPADYAQKSYDVPAPYNFNWAVKDDYAYNNFGQHESSDGYGHVSGSYHTLLPDGRTQIVTYKADDYGYVADVKYDGYAKYPEYKAADSYHKGPSYSAPKYEAPKYEAPKYEPKYAAPKY
ncbi:cuticle protein 8-like isoform X10 [Daphnia pulex]|uniref:cuticle protein 8-like isoform X9 n=1 Tax=Daphnia pulex TaxID=6669 RepID=UPI001EE13E8F|nr:cuticle protein 8-like isoform X9 [Daphnia pulex]XP_046463055.1 cuticle protein 8-like isoform X10 [Daphnia pulex]